jgi:DNA-binding winged helix-turn-helix (wHTH) protein
MRVRFGAFVFDAGTRQLFCGEHERRLAPKAFDLLELLLTHRPNVVAKHRIRDRLWPATAVSDSTLATVMAELRAALEEDPKRPHLLRTVHGVGYAFCGEATELEPSRAASLDPRSFRLVLDDREVPLREGENLLGRVEDGLIWVESPTVSRRHARILVENGQAILEDLDSKNGTFLNGQRISCRTILSDGNQIRLGRVTMTFRILRIGRATRTDVSD